MTEKELGILNCNDYLRKNISTFLEAFVKFYGEDSRSILEKKFSNAIFVGYQDVVETDLYIKKIERIYTQLFLKEELEKVGMENQQEFFFSDCSFENNRLMRIFSFEKFYELYLLGYENRKNMFIKNGFNNFKMVKPDATMEEYNQYLQEGTIPIDFFIGKPKSLYNNALYYVNMNNSEGEFNRYKDNFYRVVGSDLTDEDKRDFINSKKFHKYKLAYECYKRAFEKYKLLQIKLQPYNEYVEKSRILESSLRKKYYKEYVLASSFLFTDKELKEIENYFNSAGYVVKPGCLKALSSDINSSLVSSFSIESQNKLDNPDTFSWKKASIIRDRIEFFKSKGLNLGDEYQAYIDSEEAKAIWPSFEVAERVEKIRAKCNNDFNNEYYTSISSYKKIQAEILNRGLLDPNNSIDASLYTLHGTYVIPNIVNDENGFKLFPIVCIHVIDDNQYLDHLIVHELNHLYELYMISRSGSKIEYLCGWDYLQSNLDDESKEVDTIHENEDRRKYELFNEIVNELIAQDISKIMVENNLFVFNDSNQAKYEGYTSYEQTIFLVREFYNEFFTDILESRKNGNIEVIFDRVGKENFDDLNSLFITFNENFGGANYYRVVSDLQKNVETAETRLFYELVEKKDAILDNMRNYKKNNISI